MSFGHTITLGCILITTLFNLSRAKDSDLNKQFIRAAYNGENETIKELIKNGADINAVDENGQTAIMLALDSDSEAGDKTVTLILDLGIDVNLQDKNGTTALIKACLAGYGNSVEQIIRKGAKVNVQDENGYTALHYAVNRCGYQIYKPLLKAGADPNIVNDRGNTPLHQICEDYFRPDNLEAIEYLVNAKANLNIENNLHQTPLMLAASKGNIEILKLLHKSGASLDYRNIYGLSAASFAQDSTAYGAKSVTKKDVVAYLKKYVKLDSDDKFALLGASKDGSVQKVKDLLKTISPDVINGDLESPLHLACSKKHWEIVQLLISKKANVNQKDDFGRTPFMITVSKGNLDIVKEMMKAGADINLADNEGKTVLNYYVDMKDKTPLIDYLLKEGANVKAVSKNGLTSVHNAARSGNLELVKLLVKEGADPTKTTNDDMVRNDAIAPFHAALRNGHFTVAEYLLQFKPDLDTKLGIHKETMLIQACKEGKTDIIDFLLKNGAALDLEDEYGYTALHALVGQHSESRDSAILNLIGVLINKKVRVNFPVKTSPIHVAAKLGDLECVEFLINHKADINSRDQYGQTPFMAFVSNGSYNETDSLNLKNGIEFFIRHKAELNTVDEKGRTAIMYTIDNRVERNYKTYKLLDYPYDLNIKDKDGNTLLMKTCRGYDYRLVQKIVKKGADVNLKDAQGRTALEIAVNETHNHLIWEVLLQAGNTFEKQNWQVYRNGNFGIEVEYGEFWLNGEDGNLAIFKGPSNSECNLTIHCIEKKKFVNLSALHQEWVRQWKTAEGYKLASEKKVSIAEEKWTETEVTYTRDGSSYRQVTIFLEKNDKYYVLSFTSWGPYELMVPYYEHLKKSLKFI